MYETEKTKENKELILTILTEVVYEESSPETIELMEFLLTRIDIDVLKNIYITDEIFEIPKNECGITIPTFLSKTPFTFVTDNYDEDNSRIVYTDIRKFLDEYPYRGLTTLYINFLFDDEEGLTDQQKDIKDLINEKIDMTMIELEENKRLQNLDRSVVEALYGHSIPLDEIEEMVKNMPNGHMEYINLLKEKIQMLNILVAQDTTTINELLDSNVFEELPHISNRKANREKELLNLNIKLKTEEIKMYPERSFNLKRQLEKLKIKLNNTNA
ncbi:hypothetical protein [Bacillus bombysepticus]|uniref:hypothetical protein n=1 Tax=Bacillus bombysepticus TaxID=658666 RepID=UPI003018BC84